MMERDPDKAGVLRRRLDTPRDSAGLVEQPDAKVPGPGGGILLASEPLLIQVRGGDLDGKLGVHSGSLERAAEVAAHQILGKRLRGRLDRALRRIEQHKLLAAGPVAPRCAG